MTQSGSASRQLSQCLITRPHRLRRRPRYLLPDRIHDNVKHRDKLAAGNIISIIARRGWHMVPAWESTAGRWSGRSAVGTWRRHPQGLPQPGLLDHLPVKLYRTFWKRGLSGERAPSTRLWRSAMYSHPVDRYRWCPPTSDAVPRLRYAQGVVALARSEQPTDVPVAMPSLPARAGEAKASRSQTLT